MPFSSGVAAQVGFKAETTFGTEVIVDKFVDTLGWSAELMDDWAVGQGMYSGGQYERLARTVRTTQHGEGSLEGCVVTRSWGTLLKHMLGSSVTTPTLIAASAYKQVHQVASTDGMSLTVQAGVPQVSDGVVKPQTLVGAKVKGWELKCEQGRWLTASLDLVAKNYLTLTTTPAAGALAAASYPAQEGYTWNQAVVKLGGTVSGTTELTVSGGTTVASVVKGFSLAHTNNLNDEGYGTGSTWSREPKAKKAEIVLSLDAEFNTQAELYDLYRAGTVTAVQITFTGSVISGTDANKVDIICIGKLRKAPVSLDSDDLAMVGVELVLGRNDAGQSPLQVRYDSADSVAL